MKSGPVPADFFAYIVDCLRFSNHYMVDCKSKCFDVVSIASKTGQMVIALH